MTNSSLFGRCGCPHFCFCCEKKRAPDQSSWGRVPPFVCPHARVREWVRGRKKERFQSKKLEKIRPICHIYHYTTAPSARFLRLSFLAAPRGKQKRALQEIEQSGAPSRFLSLSLCLSATSHRVRSNRTIGIPKR